MPEHLFALKKGKLRPILRRSRLSKELLAPMITTTMKTTVTPPMTTTTRTPLIDKRRMRGETDPGASRHGNFMNYYQFHPAEERVRLLPHGVWRMGHPARKYVGLDIGCNVGDLTLKLHHFLEGTMVNDDVEVFLLGIDLDPILIERAREHNTLSHRVTFECLDICSQDCKEWLQRYLVTVGAMEFDVIFCFSITMWIHLNHGDEGLVKSLRLACSLTRMIVIEPQPWKCYRNASRRLKRGKSENFPLLKTLKYTGDMEGHIENILSQICRFYRLTVTDCNPWQRRLFIYTSTQHN